MTLIKSGAKFAATSLGAIAFALASPLTPALADGHSDHSTAAAQAGDLEQLVAQVDIPHERFQLENGLSVIVHEDRKAPIVGVAVWYNVGSKDEPVGKTGFAHLFENPRATFAASLTTKVRAPGPALRCRGSGSGELLGNLREQKASVAGGGGMSCVQRSLTAVRLHRPPIRDARERTFRAWKSWSARPTRSSSWK